jgi:hypothetical protein
MVMVSDHESRYFKRNLSFWIFGAEFLDLGRDPARTSNKIFGHRFTLRI